MLGEEHEMKESQPPDIPSPSLAQRGMGGVESSLSLEAGNQEKRVTGKVSGHRQLTSGFINGRGHVHRGLRGPLFS